MGERMKVHHSLSDGQQDIVLERAKLLELDLIDYDSTYRVYKIASKNSSNIDLNETRCIARGSILLTGTKEYVCLFVHGMREWYRTSPIVTCNKKGGKAIIIETANSFYELVEDE
jgi:hypothetical protein